MAEFKRPLASKREEEKTTRSTIILGFLTVGLVVAVVVFGLPVLVRLSIFLGEVKNSRSGEIKEKVLPPLPPRLVVPFEATNSAKINISGLAEAGAVVELLKNEVVAGELVVSDKGDFNFEGVELEAGVNTFAAIARTEGGGSSEVSRAVEIVFDNQAPILTMINPSEISLVVDYADFDVVGQTEKGISVLVNGRVAMVDDEGKFKLRIQLVAGKNEVEMAARDLAGNETRKKVEIKYDI